MDVNDLSLANSGSTVTSPIVKLSHVHIHCPVTLVTFYIMYLVQVKQPLLSFSPNGHGDLPEPENIVFNSRMALVARQVMRYINYKKPVGCCGSLRPGAGLMIYIFGTMSQEQRKRHQRVLIKGRGKKIGFRWETISWPPRETTVLGKIWLRRSQMGFVLGITCSWNIVEYSTYPISKHLRQAYSA